MSSSVAQYRIKKALVELASKTGRGTELVSLYIPPNKALHEVMAALREEAGTASNIKSDTTRNHVLDALTRTMQRLKLYRRTPDNGLVIFCGALPTNGPGSETIFLYEIDPPKPIQTYLYRCDDHFHLEILRDTLKEEKAIGILSMDTTEAGLATISGDRLEVVDVMTSGVSGKHRAGGQSARRFERMREMELTEYFNRITRHTTKAFLEDNKIEGLIVSGPGPTKNNFLKEGYLDYRLQKNILGVIDSSYAGREGIRETVEKAEDILKGLRLVEERRLVQNFLREINSSSGLAIYGIEPVLNSFPRANVDTVLIVDDIDTIRLHIECPKIKKEIALFVPRRELIQKKQKLLAELAVEISPSDCTIKEEDIIEYFATKAIEAGTKVEVISSKSEEGAMLESFGGVAAILRYR